MKQIVLLIFSFYGISSAICQTNSPVIDNCSAKIYPNPTKNKLQVAVSGFNAGWIFLKFLDKRGTTVRQEKRMLINGNELVTIMFFLEPGNYWLLITQNNHQLRKTVLIK